MFHRIAAAPLVLLALSGAALAQDNPRTVGVSVEDVVVEVPVDLAAEACGVDAETLLAEWEGLGSELSTMADTSVQADATDLAPEVAVDTQMDAAIDGQSVTDGADATNAAGGGAAPDVASDVNADVNAAGGTDTAAAEEVSDVQATAADAEPGSEPGVPADGTMDAGVEATADAGTGDDPATADAATTPELAAGGTVEAAGSGPATPTEGTVLSKSAVCEVSRETADSLGIVLPG